MLAASNRRNNESNARAHLRVGSESEGSQTTRNRDVNLMVRFRWISWIKIPSSSTKTLSQTDEEMLCKHWCDQVQNYLRNNGKDEDDEEQQQDNDVIESSEDEDEMDDSEQEQDDVGEDEMSEDDDVEY
ncbi:hmu [Acrasis kona]|uniref:Hmu n=1 Tax=Acrasis kona TaxID=1008807 RepID=A0AAW2Z475_9EUKA